MPNLNMVIPHQLLPEEVLIRIKKMLNKIKDENPDKISEVKEQWTGYTGEFSFTAQSFLFYGKITVEPFQIKLDAELPLVAMIFKGKIEETIRKEAERLLTVTPA
jgi:hypothetical protein